MSRTYRAEAGLPSPPMAKELIVSRPRANPTHVPPPHLSVIFPAGRPRIGIFIPTHSLYAQPTQPDSTDQPLNPRPAEAQTPSTPNCIHCNGPPRLGPPPGEIIPVHSHRGYHRSRCP